MKKKIKTIVLIFFIIPFTYAQQYLVLQSKKDLTIDEDILTTKYSNNKILNINCIATNNDNENFLIHCIVFSNSDGNFNKKIVTQSALNKNNCVTIESMILLAKTNTQLDQNREISYYEFENKCTSDFFIQTNSYHIVTENRDKTFTVYEDVATIYFYEIKQYKQFTPFQTCASIINTNSLTQKITRNNISSFESEIEFSNDSLGNYFPNKIFLEKVNSDGSFHFVRFKQLCHDCSNNFSFEFDFDNKKGIFSLWYYIQNITGKKPSYVRFSK